MKVWVLLGTDHHDFSWPWGVFADRDEAMESIGTTADEWTLDEDVLEVVKENVPNEEEHYGIYVYPQVHFQLIEMELTDSRAPRQP